MHTKMWVCICNAWRHRVASNTRKQMVTHKKFSW